MGTGGYRLLISQALAQAREDAKWLGDVRLNADGTFEGLDAAYATTSQAEFQDGCLLILAHVLDLLVKFIGVEMTQTVLRDTWPRTPLGISELQEILK